MRNFITACNGSVAVYFALLAPVLVGFAALGTEVGLWLIKERRLQHVADSAAYAVAMRSISVTDIVTLENLAIKVANLPNSPPELIAGEDTYTITISHSLPRQLTRIFNREEPDVTIRVRAVAKVFLPRWYGCRPSPKGVKVPTWVVHRPQRWRRTARCTIL